MDFIVPKRRDTAVRGGTENVSRPQPAVREGARPYYFTGNRVRPISSNLPLPYNGRFQINLHPRQGISYVKVDTFIIPMKTKINAFRGVAAADGGGAGANPRPAYGQLFPRGDS